MATPSPAILYYVHDPMCSWCWGMRPEWLKLKQSLSTNIQLVTRVGGLAPDSDKAMAESLQQDIQSTWKHIQQVIPGTDFNFNFWDINTPRRSTYPACRAVITAREMADKENQMTYAIQQAYYLNAKNPSDSNTLIEAAGSIDLDTTEFESLLHSSQIQTAFETELEQVRSIGVYSFPSLVLQLGDQLHSIQLNYNSAQNMLRDIIQLLPQQAS